MFYRTKPRQTPTNVQSVFHFIFFKTSAFDLHSNNCLFKYDNLIALSILVYYIDNLII